MVVLAAHLRLYEERSLSFHFAVQISPTGVGSGTLDALSDGADEEDEEEASAEEADDASSEAKAAAAKNAGARTVESLMISYGFFLEDSIGLNENCFAIQEINRSVDLSN